MNISSEIFPTTSNYSDYLFYNDSVLEDSFEMTSLVDIFFILFDLPTNCYVIWLIMTGTGNGLAAEFFSLNLAVCEIFLCLQSLMSHFTYKVEILWIAVLSLDGQGITGRLLFQCLICVERYLAVVHPVTFLKYKPLRYRVICSVIVVVASFVSSGIIIFFFNVPAYVVLVFFVCTVPPLPLHPVVLSCGCSQSSEAVRTRREKEREREEENHMKRRAFYLILITTVTMFILYAPYIIVVALCSSTTVHYLLSSIGSVCFSLAGLVQPLLFLYRVRKLPFIKCH